MGDRNGTYIGEGLNAKFKCENIVFGRILHICRYHCVFFYTDGGRSIGSYRLSHHGAITDECDVRM